ncbi:radical SAM/SPASM domain-containing protein [Sandaracinus amylolyticus]|uniref:Heme biosynthesis protein n=1 Tax=Sandaracinus amylolyticus TaxID=927083 RepID=A0A0F6SGN4_9BACT|nr:radical SAM protein [Sandaracinus amylolyticus]AKF08999.1 heme biosynthesis protein [Sandaracinus amylolyticus]
MTHGSIRDPRVTPIGETGLRYVVWELTLRCDLACRHCGSRAGKAREDELSTDEALDVVRQLASMGAREVVLIGGEAYLRDDWTIVARAIADAGMRCAMVSGGRGLDATRARAAREAGVASVSISIDGIGATHDVQRGLDGAFESARVAMRNLRDAGVTLQANTQVNRLSYPELDAILDLLVEERATGWQLAMTVPMGRAADRPDWLLQPHELLEVYPKLAALAERGARHGVLFFPGNNIGYFGPHEATLRGRGITDDVAWGGCIAGKHAMGIESDGSIKGCPSLPSADWVGGTAREASLREIWEQTRELRYVRDRELPGALWGECARCYYASVCGGGCTWTAHTFFGRPGNNPYCHHRALEMRARGERERLVRVEAAPGAPFDHGRWEIVVEPWVEGEGVARVERPSKRLRVL